MRQITLVASAILLIAFTIVSCKRSELQSSSKPQPVRSNVVSDVKNQTGVDLPKSCSFIFRTNSPRLDADAWIVEMDRNTTAQFPQQLKLQPQGDARKMAALMERMSGISVGMPDAWFFGTWQVSNAQCHATLITTRTNQYLMLERFY